MSASWKGFRPLYKFTGGTSIIPTPYMISNSMTLYEGSAVKLVAAAGVEPADAATGGDVVFGYVVGFVTKSGLPVQSVSTLTAEVGTITYTAAATGDSIVTDSDNETTVHIAALTVQAFGLVCSAKMDATVGTTTGSDTAGYYTDILETDGARTLDESDTTNGIATFQLVPSMSGDSSKATDPLDPTNRVYVQCAETQVGVSTAETT